MAEFQVGDLVWHFKSLNARMHKIVRGIVVERKVVTAFLREGDRVYKIVTTEGECLWLREDEFRRLEEEVKCHEKE